MKDFIRRLARFAHKISVIISTPPARPLRVSSHCTNINMLLMHLCDFDDKRYSYVLQWLAYPLKHPGAKMSYGLVVSGGEGTGKKLFFHDVALALHRGKGRIIHATRLSDHLAGCLDSSLVVIDGNFTQRTVARVKALMTSKSVTIEAGATQLPREIPNQINFAFLSGDTNPICDFGGSRRFMIIDAPPRRERCFYQAIRHEIKNGGVDAFRDYLMHGIDLEGFNESTLPPGLRDDPVPSTHAAKAIRQRPENRAVA